MKYTIEPTDKEEKIKTNQHSNHQKIDQLKLKQIGTKKEKFNQQ